jgi:hypothetical protein
MMSPIIDWMFKNKFEKHYTPGKCRMSKEVFDFFSEFRENGVIDLNYLMQLLWRELIFGHTSWSQTRKGMR